jgi:hypothetical protein
MMAKNPEIEKILQVPWTYTLYQSGERLFLSVLCRSRGGADYSMAIELGTQEIDAYRSLGKESIDVLSSKIMGEPSAYAEWDIKGFSKWPKASRMNADWHIPAESPLASLAYAVAQEKLHAVLQQAKVAGPKKLQARSLREAQAFCCLMRKTRVAFLQDGADLDVLVVSSSQADLLGASGVSLISFELSEPNFSAKGLGAGSSSLIPPHGFVALAMRTIMEVESELQAGRPGDAEKVDLAVDGILDVLEGIPLDQSSVPPEAFGDDAYFQSLSPEKKAQFTRVELVRLVGQLRAIGADPVKVENTRFFIAGQRPVKIENTPKGDREFAIDWKTGEFIKTDLYIRKIFRDHSPDIDEVDQATFEKRVTKIRAKIRGE